jgi:hypothetical protein
VTAIKGFVKNPSLQRSKGAGSNKDCFHLVFWGFSANRVSWSVVFFAQNPTGGWISAD